MPGAIDLQAGAMKMLYEEGSVRYISWNGIEIIRMVYASLRDKAWLTAKPEISGLKVSRNKNGFRLSFEGHYRMNEIDFMAHFDVEASMQGHLIFRMKGKALTTFSRNRIGFCVLHPIDSSSGKTCTLLHPDRTASSHVFPVSVSPQQPFTNVAGMQWMPAENLKAELNFQGDIFETEDQRNWTDASFKTYCTPLELPYPVIISQGTEITQQVELKISGQLQVTGPGSETANTFSITGEAVGIQPEIGIGISSRLQPPSAGEGDIIRNIGFSHLQAALFLHKTHLDLQYARIAEESEKTGLSVELFLFFGDNPVKELESFVVTYHKAPLILKSILILSETGKATPDHLIGEVIPLLRREFGHVQVGAGTNCNFAQLNRSMPETTGVDFISFAVHPQEHAADNRSMIENTAGQQYAVKTALQFNGYKPVHVSPLTLQRRFNANVENYESPRAQDEMPSQVDPRQMSLFGAAWTVGSLKYLLEAGAGSITYFETLGERGIMMGDHGSRWPGQFPAKKGMVFPVFHVFRILLVYRGSKIIRCKSNRPLLFDGFAIQKGKWGLVFLANMMHKKQIVHVTGINKSRTFFSMHEGNYSGCCLVPDFSRPENKNKHYSKHSGIMLMPFETRVLQYIRH